jgi:hypothetical protein
VWRENWQQGVKLIESTSRLSNTQRKFTYIVPRHDLPAWTPSYIRLRKCRHKRTYIGNVAPEAARLPSVQES